MAVRRTTTKSTHSPDRDVGEVRSGGANPDRQPPGPRCGTGASLTKRMSAGPSDVACSKTGIVVGTFHLLDDSLTTQGSRGMLVESRRMQ